MVVMLQSTRADENRSTADDGGAPTATAPKVRLRQTPAVHTLDTPVAPPPPSSFSPSAKAAVKPGSMRDINEDQADTRGPNFSGAPRPLPLNDPDGEVKGELKPAERLVAAPSKSPRVASASASIRAVDKPPAPSPDKAASDHSELTAELLVLRAKIRRALNLYFPRRLNTRDNDAWETMHAMIAFGSRTDILIDGPSGERVSAISWLLNGNRCKGQPLMVINNGHLTARVGVNVQGHAGQFLGMLAQWHFPMNYDFVVQGRPYTLADLIEEEKSDCEINTELTFKLIALSYYLPNDAAWLTHDGQRWTVERLVQEEIKQPIRGAACGGTHRLFGLSSAYIMRERRGGLADGDFGRAKKYVADYHRYTFGTLQNPDGSFSTEWFSRSAAKPDLDRRLQTTGHTLEWLAFSLSDEQMTDPHMIRAVDYIATILLENPRKQWSIGPLGHSLHALVMYDQRMFSEQHPVSVNGALPGRTQEISTSASEPTQARTASAEEAADDDVYIPQWMVEPTSFTAPAELPGKAAKNAQPKPSSDGKLPDAKPAPADGCSAKSTDDCRSNAPSRLPPQLQEPAALELDD